MIALPPDAARGGSFVIYLDFSANAPVDERVLVAFCEAERGCIGNANSAHVAGQQTHSEMERAVTSIAAGLGALPDEVILTSGASEANNLAIKGIARASRHLGRHIISTPLEHASVSGALTALQEQGWEIDLLDVRRDGTIDLEQLQSLLRRDTALVAVSRVDSELGTVQPVREVSEILRDFPQCRLHVDATQAVGKLPLSFAGMELIRPMYCIREEDILAWKRYNELEFIQCACRFTENCTMCDNGGGGSKRQEIKTLLRRLSRDNPDLETIIFNSVHAVCLDTMAGYKSKGVKHSFLERYDDPK